MKEEDYTPEEASMELNELLVKAGRRCAYDLRHAADYMAGDDDFQKMMYQRAKHWLSIFNSGGDAKNYRHQLHHIIADLEREVERLQELCKAHGVSDIDIARDIPF